MNYDNYFNGGDLIGATSSSMSAHHVMMPSSSSGYERIDPRLSNYHPINTSLVSDSQQKIHHERNDEQWIASWLVEKSQVNVTAAVASSSSQLPAGAVVKSKNDIPIHLAKESLKQCLLIMRKINLTQTELQQNVDTMSSAEWKVKTVDIGNLKDEFNKLMVKFEDLESITSLRRTVKKREKKRVMGRMRKARNRELVAGRKEERQKMHKNIDEWLESMKEAAEKAKLEERQKKDADCVLYEVTKKKSDARKQLSLIYALVKLRTVRESMRVQRGEHTSAEDRKAFGLVTEKLVRMWEDSLQKYTNEEQLLQNKLTNSNAIIDSDAAKLAKEKQIGDEWDTVLFGSKQGEHNNNPAYWAFTSAERDLETFVAIRKSWDTFLVARNHEMGTKIPLGWVLPTANSNWANYLAH